MVDEMTKKFQNIANDRSSLVRENEEYAQEVNRLSS